jgi:hypothetical protein
MSPSSVPHLKANYESPILALEHNVVFAFENVGPGFVDQLQKAFDTGLIAKHIDLRMDLVSPRGPKVTREASSKPAVFHLHVTHLEMLWAFIYGWMILFEEDIQKPQIDDRSPLAHGATPLSRRALDLLSRPCKTPRTRMNASFFDVFGAPILPRNVNR